MGQCTSAIGRKRTWASEVKINPLEVQSRVDTPAISCAGDFPLKLKTTKTVYTACIMRNLTQPTIRSSRGPLESSPVFFESMAVAAKEGKKRTFAVHWCMSAKGQKQTSV